MVVKACPEVLLIAEEVFMTQPLTIHQSKLEVSRKGRASFFESVFLEDSPRHQEQKICHQCLMRNVCSLIGKWSNRSTAGNQCCRVVLELYFESMTIWVEHYEYRGLHTTYRSLVRLIFVDGA